MKKQSVFIRTQYNYDPNAATNESGLACPEATRAQQHHREECDINEIMRRFGKTGVMPITTLNALYGDFESVDYHTALNQIIASEREFDALPSNIRKRFDNDPWELVQFLQNDNNREQAIELGLLNKPALVAQEITTTDTPE